MFWGFIKKNVLDQSLLCTTLYVYQVQNPLLSFFACATYPEMMKRRNLFDNIIVRERNIQSVAI